MSQKTLNLCLERYNFIKFGETTKSSHTVLCINNAYSVNSDKYRLTPTAIAGKHGDGYVFTLNYDFDRPLFTIVQKSYTLDGTSGNIVFEGIDPISKGGSKYLRKVTVSPVKLSDGSYLLEVTNDEYLRIGTTGAALGDEDLESLNEKIVTDGGITKSVETVGGKQVLKLDAGGPSGTKEIVYFDVDPSAPPSGIYEAIGEALANNKEPVIKNDGAVYFYSSTGTDKYVFVGGYDTDVVNYTTVTVSDNDSVVKETVDTIEGMVFPLYYHSNNEGFTVADKTGHALTKTEIVNAYRAGQIFMFSSYPASNTQAHWGYCCDINIDSNNTGYANFFILAAFGGDSYEWEKYRINLSSGTEFVTLWGPNTSYSTGYSGSYADGATTVSVSTTQNFNSTQKAKGRENIGAASASDVTALQSQVSSLSDVSAYIVKGEATVAQLNAGPSGIQAGWAYQLTDSGTLTDGTLAVVAGDTVAWDGTKWFMLVNTELFARKDDLDDLAEKVDNNYETLDDKIDGVKDVVPEGTSEENPLVNNLKLYKELHRVPNSGTLLAGAKVGDILWVDPENGDKYFFDKAVYPVSQAVADGLESVGVVADVDGRKLLILHKDESTDLQFANCWLYKVTGIRLDGTTNTLKMQQHASNGDAVAAGTFTDNTSTTLADFCAALDTWIREHQTVAGASETNWHCELMPDADGVDSCFIVVDTNSYQNRLTPIASGSTATATLYMWQFANQTTDRSTLLRNNGSNVYYAGFNKERLIEWFRNPSNASISPTNDPNGAGLLNLTDFNGTSYPAVKEYYGDYETYMEAMMMKWPSETGSQAALAGTGHDIGLVLGTHTHKNLAGESVFTFSANRYSYTRATEATRKSDGLGDGDWYLPDVVDAFKVFSKMNVDGTDAISDSLSAISARRALSVPRWLATRYYNYSAWYFSNNGYFGGQNFSGAFRVPTVALLEY